MSTRVSRHDLLTRELSAIGLFFEQDKSNDVCSSTLLHIHACLCTYELS